jgi:hypothetical protein
MLSWRPGQLYDVPAPLAAYLVAEGLGIVEMRTDQPPERPVTPDRRRNGLPTQPTAGSSGMRRAKFDFTTS